MKKIMSATILALAVGGAQAQVYVGGTAGVSHFNADCAGTDSCDNTGSGFKLYGGYEFNKNFALEAGYLDFGKANAGAYTFVGGANRLVQLDIKTHAIFLAAAVRGDFTPAFGGAARLGLAGVKSKVDVAIPSLGAHNQDSSSATKAYFGLSLDYAFTKNLKGVVAADFTTADVYDDTAAVRLFTIGAQYNF